MHSVPCLTFIPLVPRTFYIWWLDWNEADPNQFPLPPAMWHFGPIDPSARFIRNTAVLDESDATQLAQLGRQSRRMAVI